MNLTYHFACGTILYLNQKLTLTAQTRPVYFFHSVSVLSIISIQSGTSEELVCLEPRCPYQEEDRAEAEAVGELRSHRPCQISICAAPLCVSSLVCLRASGYGR